MCECDNERTHQHSPCSPFFSHSLSFLFRITLNRYGGITQDYQVLSDVWKFTTGKWTEIKIPENKETPPARWLHSMIPFNDRYIVHGGCSETSGPLGDTWEFDGKTSWTQLGSDRHYPPPARYLHRAVGMTTGSDPQFSMIIHGGSVNNVRRALLHSIFSLLDPSLIFSPLYHLPLLHSLSFLLTHHIRYILMICGSSTWRQWNGQSCIRQQISQWLDQATAWSS